LTVILFETHTRNKNTKAKRSNSEDKEINPPPNKKIAFLTGTASTRGARLALRIDGDGGENDGLGTFLKKSVLGDGLESLLDVDGLLGRGFEEGDITLGLTPLLETLGGNDTSVLHIDLVADDDEGETVGVARSGLDQELIAPAVEVVEGLGDVNVEHKHAAISTTIESDTERLETLLTGSIPDLKGDKTIVNHDFLGEEISTDGGTVLVGELLVDVLVHQRSLTHTTVTKDDNLQQNLLARSHFSR